MARTKGDTQTLDLLKDWHPTPVAKSFDRCRVAGADIRSRIKRALAEAVRNAGIDRSEIVEKMGEILGSSVSAASFDKSTSVADESHELTVSKFVAFMKVVPDVRVANELFEETEFAVIPRRYLAAVDEAMCMDQIEQLQLRAKTARREWSGPRK